MALKATIYKAHLNIADMDREYYGDYNLTIACHPSETEFRLMVRILAFALFASEALTFTKGLSTDDEPDIWEKDLTGQITHWIELGVPDETRVRKGCQRAERAAVVAYGDRSAAQWWEKNRGKLQRFDNLRVLFLADQPVEALVALMSRGMDMQVSIQDGQLWVNMAGETVEITPEIWK